MASCKPRIIHERTNIIPISPSSPTNKELQAQCSLKENLFDPSKGSPPNEFLKKLQLRMNIYNSPTNSSSTLSTQIASSPIPSHFLFSNDDNFVIE